MDILRKFLGIWIYSAAAGFALIAVMAVVGTDQDPEPEWAVAIISAIISLAIFGLGQKVWPKKQTHLTHLAAPITYKTAAKTASTKPEKNTTSITANPTPEAVAPAITPKPIRDEMTGREIRGLYDLAQQVLMDMKVTRREADKLLDWFEDHPAAQSDYRSSLLYRRLVSALEDGRFDAREADDICYWLGDFCDGVDDELEEFNFHEDHAEVGIDGLVAGGKYLMVYTDAQGARSERAIKFSRQSFSNGNAYIHAICLTKNANRTFRVDRIETLFSMDSGEVLL